MWRCILHSPLGSGSSRSGSELHFSYGARYARSRESLLDCTFQQIYWRLLASAFSLRGFFIERLFSNHLNAVSPISTLRCPFCLTLRYASLYLKSATYLSKHECWPLRCFL